jgi:hypothetical protein
MRLSELAMDHGVCPPSPAVSGQSVTCCRPTPKHITVPTRPADTQFETRGTCRDSSRHPLLAALLPNARRCRVHSR